LSRKEFIQTIIEKPNKKNGKPNPRYPGHKTIVHLATDTSANDYLAKQKKDGG
jgi:hypothetical protein